MKKKIDRVINIALICVFLIGLSLLLYPTISDWWNSFHQSQTIETYSKKVESMDTEVYQQELEDAASYNQEIADNGIRWTLTKQEFQRYNDLLNVADNGVMCYVEIPQIKCKLPVYHGTDESVLQIAIGHLPGTSLPIGGPSTHCVISGHRGLPKAKLFSNIDQLQKGDHFMLHTLNETLTYEVDQIRIVLPNELDDLQIVPGEDLCTLVTCTPYGVNSHRLLVRGHRVENDISTMINAEAIQIDKLIVASAVAVPMLIALLIWMIVTTRKKKKKGDIHEDKMEKNK